MCRRKDPLKREKSRKSVKLLKANKSINFLCDLRLWLNRVREKRTIIAIKIFRIQLKSHTLATNRVSEPIEKDSSPLIDSVVSQTLMSLFFCYYLLFVYQNMLCLSPGLRVQCFLCFSLSHSILSAISLLDVIRKAEKDQPFVTLTVRDGLWMMGQSTKQYIIDYKSVILFKAYDIK